MTYFSFTWGEKGGRVTIDKILQKISKNIQDNTTNSICLKIKS